VTPLGLAVDKVLIPRLLDEHHTCWARRVGPQRDETTVMVGVDLTGALRCLSDDN
jgi:hypothetical protein